jgi:predicted TIM-barrel fold metal-dependent hydrolase
MDRAACSAAGAAEGGAPAAAAPAHSATPPLQLDGGVIE